MERLLTRGNYLVDGCTPSSAKVVKQMIDRVRQRWYAITQGIDDCISRFRILSRDFMEFEEERRSVNAWLTEIEVRLIGLDQVEEEQKDEEERLQELKVIIQVLFSFVATSSFERHIACMPHSLGVVYLITLPIVR